MNTLAGAVAHHVEFNNDHKYFSIAVDDGFASLDPSQRIFRP